MSSDLFPSWCHWKQALGGSNTPEPHPQSIMSDFHCRFITSVPARWLVPLNAMNLFVGIYFNIFWSPKVYLWWPPLFYVSSISICIFLLILLVSFREQAHWTESPSAHISRGQAGGGLFNKLFKISFNSDTSLLFSSKPVLFQEIHREKRVSGRRLCLFLFHLLLPEVTEWSESAITVFDI